jgi:hypothetical protein
LLVVDDQEANGHIILERVKRNISKSDRLHQGK